MDKELNQKGEYEEMKVATPPEKERVSSLHKSSWADALEEEDVDIVDTTKQFSVGAIKDWIIDHKLITAVTGGAIFAIVILIIVVALMFNKDAAPEDAPVVEEVPDYSWMYEEEAKPDPEPIFVFTYPEDTYVSLRAAGFTARQIEELEALRADVTPYLKKAAENKKEWAAEQFKALLRNSEDSTDLQYTYLMGNTYLGLQPQEIDINSSDYSVVSYKEVVNYWKMPMQGWQPTIKVRLKSGEILYFQVTPQRYVNLDDSGSIAITYTVSEIYGARFITDVKEVDI